MEWRYDTCEYHETALYMFGRRTLASLYSELFDVHPVTSSALRARRSREARVDRGIDGGAVITDTTLVSWPLTEPTTTVTSCLLHSSRTAIWIYQDLLYHLESRLVLLLDLV